MYLSALFLPACAPMAVTSERTIEVGGHPVTYRVAGEGKPVVLVHGLAGSMRWWRYTVPSLARSYRVYLVDLPGFGSMRSHPRAFALDAVAGWLESWIEAVQIDSAHLVGHSMGAYICLTLAARRPDLVDRLVLVDPAGVPTGRSIAGHLMPLAKDALLSSPAFLPLLVRDALRAGPHTLWRAARDLLREDVRDQLQKISSPTLIVWGENDSLVPPSAGLLLQKGIKHSQLALLHGAHHVPMFDRPREFNEVLLRFLSKEAGMVNSDR